MAELLLYWLFKPYQYYTKHMIYDGDTVICAIDSIGETEEDILTGLLIATFSLFAVQIIYIIAACCNCCRQCCNCSGRERAKSCAAPSAYDDDNRRQKCCTLKRRCYCSRGKLIIDGAFFQ